MKTNSEIDKNDLIIFYRAVAKRCPARMQPCDVEDLAQDMLADAVEVSAKTGIPILALAFKNATRTRYYVRAAGRISALRDYEDLPNLPEVETVNVRSRITDVESIVDTSDPVERLEIVDMIAKLEDHLADVARLRYLDDMTVEATASALRISMGTVHNRTKAAEVALRETYRAALSA